MSLKAAEAVWNEILEELKEQVPEQSFNTWFSNIEPVSADGEKLELGAANLFVKNWLERNYLKTIKEAFQRKTGMNADITLVISPNKYREMRRNQQEEGVYSASPAPAPLATPIKQPTLIRNDSPANPEFTLDTFVASPNIAIAAGACMRLADHQGEYNPLLIYGGHGLGKTHLLHAVYHSLKAKDQDCKIILTSGEEFMADFVRAMGSHRIEQFRIKYRSCSALLIDDIQALGTGKRNATLEEFLNTIDRLANLGRQIVITCDRHPSEIEAFSPRLKSRLTSGLAAEIEKPSKNHRAAIIRNKASRREIACPPEAVEVLARNLSGDVREIEGVIGRFAAMVNLGSMPATAATAESALVGVTMKRPSAPGLQEIAEIVAKEYGVTPQDIAGRRRPKNVCAARHAAMYIARQITACSLATIGEFFGKRSHATVLNAANSMSELLKTDGEEAERVRKTLRHLGFTGSAAGLDFDQGSLFENEATE